MLDTILEKHIDEAAHALVKSMNTKRKLQALNTKNKAREYEIVWCREVLRMSLKEIGNKFGVTKERIRQILLQAGSVPFKTGRPSKRTLVQYSCVACSKKILAYIPRKYCNNACRRTLWFDLSPEEKKIKSTKKFREWYAKMKNDPRMKEAVRRRNRGEHVSIHDFT